MNQSMLRPGLLLAVLGAFALVGCSSNQPAAEAPSASSHETSESTPPTRGEDADREGSSAGAPTPASTIDGIMAQIVDEQAKLSAAIQNGELKDVHHLAFGIRDLVTGLVEKVNADSPAGANALNGMAASVKESASKLDELGDAGDLSGTQAEFTKLETVLSGIRRAIVAK